MKSILDFVEDYIKKEGLTEIIPQKESSSFFLHNPLLITIIWVSGIWLALLLVTLGRQYYNLWFLTVLFPFIAIVVSLVGWAILLLVSKGQSFTKSPRSTTILGAFYIFYLPIVNCIYISILTHFDWFSILIFLGLNIITLILCLLVNSTNLFFRTMFQLRNISSVVVQTFSAMLSLFPFLLTIFLLSVFSEDFWVIFGDIGWGKLLVFTVSISFPVFLYFYLNKNQNPLNLVNIEENMDLIFERFYKIPFIEEKIDKKFISSSEMNLLYDSLSWRYGSKNAQYTLETLKKVVRRNFYLYFGMVTLLTFMFFFVFFFLIFLL